MTEKTRRSSVPDRRAADGKHEVAKIRRKYKVTLNKRHKLLPGEVRHVESMIVILKVAGYSQRQMAQVVGISKGQVKEILTKPEVSEEIVALRAAIPRAALELIQNYMIESIMTIVDVMRTEPDNKIVLAAAGDILDRGGMPKASRQERHQVNEDRTTFTDEGLLERLREAPIEVQERAAVMIDEFEKLLTEHADKEEEGDE
jgi:hypothetical protein